MLQQPKFIHLLAAVVLGGILLTLSWDPFRAVIPIFIGFVPLLWMEERARMQQRNPFVIFILAWIGFAVWNVGTTWWIWNASPEGAIMAFVLNSLLMTFPFMLYHYMQYRIPGQQARLIFVFFWIAFEYAHYNWEGNWTWLTLGNVFATTPSLIQWYEYTGVLGGTAWVLLVNIRLYEWIMNEHQRSGKIRFSKMLNLVYFLLFAPVFLSWYITPKITESAKNLNVLVVQPNIDPYNDKFGGMTPVEQTRKMLALAEQQMDPSVRLLCFPETALVGNLNESKLEDNASIQLMRQFILAHPQVAVITGADTYRFYPDKNHRSVTARKYDEDNYYDAYNSALLLDTTPVIQIYHKSKLVPGVECLPYADRLGFLKKLTIDLGGTSGSLGSDPDSKVLRYGRSDEECVAPVICYESIFGEYVGTYVQKHAGIITIVTNDGWWGNTPGYRQHFDYARLRAIETRRYIARSANTGVSGFIDPVGNVISETKWWTDDVLKATLYPQIGTTFYVAFGDYIGKAALMLSILYIMVKGFRRKSATR